MLKKLTIVVFALLLLTSACVNAVNVTSTTSTEPPQWTYESINVLIKHGLASNYFVELDTRYKMAYFLKDIIESVHKIYGTKGYTENGLISYNDALIVANLAYEFREELSHWNTDTVFLKDMLYVLYYPKPKPPKTDFMYANAQVLYMNSMAEGRGTAWLYDYYSVRGFEVGNSLTNKVALGEELYSKDFKRVIGVEISEYDKSGRDTLSSLYGITPMEKNVLPSRGGVQWRYNLIGDTITSAKNHLHQLNKLWYNDYKKNFSIVVGPFSPLYTNALTFTGRRSYTMYGPKYAPLYGGQFSGKSGDFRYEIYGGIRYANSSTYIYWAPNAFIRPNFYSAVPYNQITQGVSIGSDIVFYPFLKRIFKPLKSATWNINYIYTYDLTKDSYYPDFSLIAPLSWELPGEPNGTGRNNRIAMIGPQKQTVFGGNLYLSNFMKNLDFSFVGGRSFYNPVSTRYSDINGYAYEASIIGNYKPLTLAVGYRYVNPKYAPFINVDSYAIEQVHNPLIATINNFQFFDTDNYPNNLKGFFGWLNYEFKNKSVLTVNGYTREQIRSNYVLNHIEPGFIDQNFPIVTSAAFRDTLASENEIKVKYYYPYKKWTFDLTGDAYTNNRNSTGFNPLNQDAKFILANASYNVNNKIYLKGGYYKYGSKGSDAAATYRAFMQTVPSVGGFYKFNDNSSVDVSYKWFDYEDRLNSVNNYKAQQMFAEFNWKF